jgi:hypothetical protein
VDAFQKRELPACDVQRPRRNGMGSSLGDQRRQTARELLTDSHRGDRDISRARVKTGLFIEEPSCQVGMRCGTATETHRLSRIQVATVG